jgi:potassium efflux system protein
MKALRTLLIGIASSALWPLYLGLLSALVRSGPWPLSVARPLGFICTAFALALFLVNLARTMFHRQGWAVSALGVPDEVAYHLGRSLLAVIITAMVFLAPEELLTRGLVIYGGKPITVIVLARLLHLAFELSVWIVVFRLLWRRRALGLWVQEHPDQLGWVGRHPRTVSFLILLAIGTVIGLDAQGYGFTARRIAAAGGQSILLVGFLAGTYLLLVRAIDNHAWHWIRPPSKQEAAEHDQPVKDSHDLAKRLRQLVNWLVPLLGAVIGAWIWNIDLALFRSIGETQLWAFSAGSALTMGDVTKALVILLITIGVWRHMSTFFAVAIFPRMSDDPGIRYAVFTLCRYALLAVGVLAGLSAVHLGIAQIGMVLAALGVGLGFGLQEIVSNFVSGIILLLERPIRVGDIVTVSGMSGKVDRINIRATTIINADNQSIIVPNREFITSNLVNWTHKDRIIRVKIELGVAYGTCPDKVVDLLLTIAREDPDVLRNPVPGATLESFGESALQFALTVHVPDPSLAGRVRHRLSAEIHRRFQEAGIQIPRPGREVHVRTLPHEWPGGDSVHHASRRIDHASPTPPAPAMSAVEQDQEPEEAMHRCVDE